MKNLLQKLTGAFGSTRLAWLAIIIGPGIILRLVPYSQNRSLWLDEARIALNIVNRSAGQLLQPLDYSQVAPIGFLMIEKLSVTTLGNSEYALRLFPLLSGILSLILFAKLALHYLKPGFALMALSLFALSGPLIYYSFEAKQYSSDVLVSLCLLLLMIFYAQSRELSLARALLLGILGAIALWFSHPALFMLVGIGAALASPGLLQKDWTRLRFLALAYLLWAVSFGALYFISLQHLGSKNNLMEYWANNFVPLVPLSIADARKLINLFFGIFEDPAGLPLTGLAAFAFILGNIAVFRQKTEKWLVLILPLFLAMLASAFHKYPFSGRLLLFIAPALLLLVAAGIEEISEKVQRSVVITTALAGLLLLHPFIEATRYLRQPYTHEEIKPVLEYMNAHRQEGDLLYVYYGAKDAFSYYKAAYGYQDGNFIVGVYSRNSWQGYTCDLDGLRGHKRVWLLFSHVRMEKDDVNEEKLFVYHLDTIGREIEHSSAPGASVYLYDLGDSTKPNLTQPPG